MLQKVILVLMGAPCITQCWDSRLPGTTFDTTLKHVLSDQASDAEASSLYSPGNCVYDSPWFSDCDPVHFARWRVRTLVRDNLGCDRVKNETVACNAEQLPRGTRWLISAHDRCKSELLQLQSVLATLRQWVGVAQHRGRALSASVVRHRLRLANERNLAGILAAGAAADRARATRLRQHVGAWAVQSRQLRAKVLGLQDRCAAVRRKHALAARAADECGAARADCARDVAAGERGLEEQTLDNAELRQRAASAGRYHELAVRAEQQAARLETAVERSAMAVEAAKARLSELKNELMRLKAAKGDGRANLNVHMWIKRNSTTTDNDIVDE